MAQLGSIVSVTKRHQTDIVLWCLITCFTASPGRMWFWSSACLFI